MKSYPRVLKQAGWASTPKGKLYPAGDDKAKAKALAAEGTQQ